MPAAPRRGAAPRSSAWSPRAGQAFFFQAEDGIRDVAVTGVQTCALPIFRSRRLDTPILIITGHGEYDLALRALRGGAYRSEERRVGKECRSRGSGAD